MAKTDTGSLVVPHLHVDSAAGVMRLDAAGAALFAQGGTVEQQALVAASSADESLGPPATPVHLTQARFGKADRVYIKTLRDQAFQDVVIAAGRVRLTLRVDTGHLPGLTNSEGLTTAIETAATFVFICAGWLASSRRYTSRAIWGSTIPRHGRPPLRSRDRRLGSGLIGHSQKMAVAARATAETKAVRRRS